MTVEEMFNVGEIMEWEDKAKSIEPLNENNCVIVSKVLNKYKIILHLQRENDKSEGNVFVSLKEEFKSNFQTSKKLLASKDVLGLTLKQLKKIDTEKI